MPVRRLPLVFLERRNQRWWLIDGFDLSEIETKLQSIEAVLEVVHVTHPQSLVAIRGPAGVQSTQL